MNGCVYFRTYRFSRGGVLRFIGIDLAWSERNPSGVAIIDCYGMVQQADAERLTNDDIWQFSDLDLPDGAVVAIDAPLVVRNPENQRPVEKRLAKVFGAFHAAPYPANSNNWMFGKGGRIQQFVRRLERTFTQVKTVPQQEGTRSFLEVYPAPALVMLFPCHQDTKHFHCAPPCYKHKAGRCGCAVRNGREIYRARLRSLEKGEPPLKFSPEVEQRLNTGIDKPKFDDLLDGIFCAYLAYYFWYWGESRSLPLGELEEGCIIIPKCVLPGCWIQECGRPCDQTATKFLKSTRP